MSIEQNEEQEISSEEKSYFAMIPPHGRRRSAHLPAPFILSLSPRAANVTENAPRSREPLRRKSASVRQQWWKQDGNWLNESRHTSNCTAGASATWNA